MRDDDEVAASLSGLSGLLSEHRALEVTLVRVASLAVQAIPGAQGAGLTLLENDRQQTVVATADFVRAVDDVQYGLGEGPCVSAVAERRTFTSGNLGGECQWPRFGPRVGRLGVHSTLSLPRLLPDRVMGALNVYAHGRDVFDSHAVRLSEAFAPPAAVSVAHAQLLAQAERLVAQLQEALTSRAEIDQAIGVIMSRTGTTAREAFDRLRSLSQSRSVKLTWPATCWPKRCGRPAPGTQTSTQARLSQIRRTSRAHRGAGRPRQSGGHPVGTTATGQVAWCSKP